MCIAQVWKKISVRLNLKLNTAFISKSAGKYFLCVRSNKYFQNWDSIKTLHRRICNSSVPKMITLTYTQFILTKNFFVRSTGFRTTFLRNGSSSSTLGFIFFTINCFRTFFVPTSFASVLSFFRPLTTSPISIAANLKQTCYNSFCRWDYIILNKGDCSSP